MSSVIRLSVRKVAQYLDVREITVYNWYQWNEDPNHVKPLNMPPLPPYGSIRDEETKKYHRYWYSDDLDKLAKFRDWLHGEGKGAMAKFNSSRYDGHYIKKIKQPGKHKKTHDERIERLHQALLPESRLVTKNELRNRTYHNENLGLPKAKWVEFCEELMEKGFTLKMYEAKKTVSKYIYVMKDKDVFKVRFSNHKPNYKKENQKDCDFFVGVTNFSVTTTKQALEAVYEFFGIR